LSAIEPYLAGILLAYAVALPGFFSPGPNMMAVIGTAMGAGRPAGSALALGVAAGSQCWGLLGLIGLTALIAAYAWLLTAVKIAGGLYLLWLGLKAFRSAARPGELPAVAQGAGAGRLAWFRRGLTIQMTNPKAALTWIAIISLGLEVDAPTWVGLTIVLGITLVSVCAHLAYAIAFSTPPMVAFYRKARRWIETALGAFFCFAGIKLLTSRP